MPFGLAQLGMADAGARAPQDDALRPGALTVLSSVRCAGICVLCLTACTAMVAGTDDAPRQLAVNVHRALGHDPGAFTQGLLWHDGKLFESTGRRGLSELRQLDPATGRVERRVPISRMHFGEGLARVADQFVMLTWHAERAYVFGVDDFSRLGFKRYRGEGWGLCHDGARFVMSDGSSTLAFRETGSFTVVGSVAVTASGRPVAGLNELECVDGAVYANVFGQDFLVRIDPATGKVTALIDASGLLAADETVGADVLNGIAFDPDTARFYVTGKLWPRMFEVTFE